MKSMFFEQEDPDMERVFASVFSHTWNKVSEIIDYFQELLNLLYSEVLIWKRQ